MNTVLSSLTGTRCFVFLDDVVIYTNSLAEHDTKLRAVFDRLRKYNLKLQPGKCEFLRKEVCYLGHIIAEEGVRPDPRKVKSVEEIPAPENAEQLKISLGLAGYYRRFVPKFSKIAAPLYTLLKGNVKFEWTEEQELAFRILKQKLLSKLVLQYPNFSKNLY
jgi:hypothetical protein